LRWNGDVHYREGDLVVVGERDRRVAVEEEIEGEE
jgi:hypothetical protein